MAADLALALLRTNLAITVAILLVLAARAPVRRAFGAEAAYRLWILAPVAGLSALVSPGLDAAPNTAAALWLQEARPALAWDPLMMFWAAGALTALATFVLGYVHALREGEQGRLGPAVVGVLHPRIFMPADFETRFSAEERALVSAHERAHVTRRDTRVNGAVMLLTCLCWFNPVVWLAVARLRLDQEMACDAFVLARRPDARRAYAATMLKVQAVRSPWLACGWQGVHPLEVRLRALTQSAPSNDQRRMAAALIAGSAAVLAAASWAAQPFRPPAAPAPEPQIILLQIRPPAP